jgi:tripartite-type tricarboxylate transporter receptor subunit TctC
MRSLLRAGVARLAWASGAPAQAEFPSRPVRNVVPDAPGEGTNINARNVAPKLTERWRHTVVIDAPATMR